MTRTGLDRESVLLALVLGLPLLLAQLLGPTSRLDADAVEYFSHLRSLYFDHDVDFANEFEHFGILSRRDKTVPTPTGHRRTNFSVGPALLWLPFYAAGDLWSRARGTVEDGYSAAHIRAVSLGSLVYGLAGLLILHRIVRWVTTASVAFWTVFLILYATFLFWYLAYEPVMSHAGSFFLSVLVLDVWLKRGERLGPGRAVLLGLLIGLATMVRWQNGILLVLPGLTILIDGRQDTRGALRAAAGLLAAFVLGILPQLAVFKAIFGVYVLPYPVQGRHYLRLDRPALLETFFSSRHGLLYWTPVLWAGFLGYLPLLRQKPRSYGLLLVPLALMSYVNACSEDWWAGGSYSNRRFDSVLPFLALGLSASLAAFRGAVARRPAGALLAAGGLLALWNLLFMEQYRRNAIPRDDTVSFARVAENSADILAEVAGTPVAWPANWVFAARHGLPADRYDLMVGKYLFLRQNNLGGVIDLGDDRADPALLGEGWSSRATREGVACRRVEGRARLFAPLDAPEDLDVTVRASGSGTLEVEVEGARVGELPLAPLMADLHLRVPRDRWRRGLSEIGLRVAPAGEAWVDRLVFEKVPKGP